MTKDEIRQLAEEVSEATVRKTLTAAGINMSSEDAIIQAQVDFVWLRRQRRLGERIGLGIRLTLITSAIGGAIAIIWAAVTS